MVSAHRLSSICLLAVACDSSSPAVDTGATGSGGSGVTGGSSTAVGTTGSGGSGGSSAAVGATGSGGSGVTGGSGSTGAPTFMGSSKLRIGGSMENESAAAAPFDVRYAYLHSQPATEARCYDNCYDGCNDPGWWGCWGTWNESESGVHVSYWDDFVTEATWQGTARPQQFFWTWYSLRDLGDAAGAGDGPDEVRAVNDVALLTRYMDDFRFFLEIVGSAPVMIHLEPDFWGFARAIDADPHQVPAEVAAANATDCASQENSVAGLARCLISMVREYAPNATVGVHASCWDYGESGGPQNCAQFLTDLGAGDGDFLVTDVADRDAAWYALQGQDWFWWTDDKAATYFAFVKTVTEAVGKPMVLWQIPLGNMAQNNTLNHYQDDKVDYLFSHLDQVVSSHVVALLFGAGHNEQTSIETDGGNLISQTNALWEAGGIDLK